MKKIVILTVPFLLFASCVKNSSEYKKLEAENDSLVAAVEKRDKEVEEYFKNLNEISETFDKIAASEKLISTEVIQGDMQGKNIVQHMKDNIAAMTASLEESKKKIAQLEARVRNGSGGNSAELKKTIARLEATVSQRGRMIDSLKVELVEREERIRILDQAVVELTKDNRKKGEMLQEQQSQISSAYYVFGSKRELKAQSILSETGVFSSSKVLESDFNKDYFVKIDVRQTTVIPVYSTKAKVLTNHPLNSYSIETVNGSKEIRIKNPAEFWSVSKYLVVETK